LVTVFQLSFLRGEKILILRQTTADWWWGERAGCCGYIPANHLGKQLEEYDPEDTWQDEEYFDSYGTLVLPSRSSVQLGMGWGRGGGGGGTAPSVQGGDADLPVDSQAPGS
jgi:hypothetical protein